MITRNRRARYGTWAFQKRELTIAHAGVSRIVPGPLPNTS